jgi:hypothetical protein
MESQGSSAGGVFCAAVEWRCMSKKSREFIDHLLIHCEVARQLCSYILNLFSVE